MMIVAAAAIGGNLVGYQCGRRLHRPWVLRHGGRLGLRRTPQARQRLLSPPRRQGRAPRAALAGAAAPVPFVAGASNLYYPIFLFYTVLGGLLWSAGAVLLGYLAGANWHRVEHWLARLGLAVLALAVLAFFTAWVWRRWKPR